MSSVEDKDYLPEWYVVPWIYSVNIILIVAAIVCSFGSFVFVFYYRKKPIVAMGQPEFLYNICFGSLLLPIAVGFAVAISISDHDENGIILLDSKTGIILNVGCNVIAWLSYIGYVVIYAALFCKIYRIMKLTQQPLRRGLTILPRHVLLPFVLVVLVTTGLLTAWSATGTSKYVVYENPDTNKTSVFCADRPHHTESPSRQILIALTIIISIVQPTLVLLAWKVRKINQELGDSKKIFRLVFFQSIVNIICIIIAPFAINKGTLVYAIQMNVTSISTVGFIILPRMYYIWYEHHHGHLPENVVMIGGGRTTVRGVNTGTGNGTSVTPPYIIRGNDNNNINNNNTSDGNSNDNGDDDNDNDD